MKIEAKVREGKQRSVLTALRNEGFVPAVLYGFETDNKSIAVKERDVIMAVREVGRNGVVELDVEGEIHNVVLHDFQKEVLRDNLTHIDFLAIDMNELLEVDVFVNPVGKAAGESEGGVVEQPVREITIMVKPTEIPETFDVNIEALNISDTITVGDIREEAPFEIVNEDEDVLVVLSAPRSEEELEALEEGLEEAGDAEPEVIGEADKEEEEEKAE